MQDAHDRDPDALGPNTRANFEMGAAMSLQDCVKAHGEQSRIFRGFQKQFEHYDLILAPTTPVSPFPWSELYLREVNGVQLDNYYRWLALCYTITLTTNRRCPCPAAPTQRHAIRATSDWQLSGRCEAAGLRRGA